MSDDIQTQAFDSQPFGHRWATSRLGDAPGAYGPPDPVEDNDLRTCLCGVETPRRSRCWWCGR